jgi:hypothetical protein
MAGQLRDTHLGLVAVPSSSSRVVLASSVQQQTQQVQKAEPAMLIPLETLHSSASVTCYKQQQEQHS